MITTKQFIERFNKGNARDRADLFIELDLKEANQHIAMKMPPKADCASVHILGYAKIRAGIWYMKNREGERILGSAFWLYPEGERTFNAWVKTVPSKKWGESLKEEIIQAFENIVMPECMSN
jgi:hypothetical protein